MNRTLQVLVGAFLALAPAGAARAQDAAAPAAPTALAKPDGKAIVPRGHWAYEALALLGHRDSDSETAVSSVELSRQQFALAIAQLYEEPYLDLLRVYKYRPNGDPRQRTEVEDQWQIVSRAEINDLLAALRREFAAELARLDVYPFSSRVKPLEVAQADGRARIARQQEAQAQLEKLQQRLRAHLAGAWQDSTLQLQGGELLGEFHCDNFAVHGSEWDGKIASWFTTRRGPNHDGFLLRVSIREGRYEGRDMMPRTEREPYWTTWHDALPLNARETDAAKIVAATKTSTAPESAEYPDVPRGHWAYKAVEALARDGLIEGLPNGNYSGYKAMTRYEFAVAIARLLDSSGFVDARQNLLATPLKPLPEPLAKPENLAALQALTREFSGELWRLGIAPDSKTPFILNSPLIRPEHLLIQLSFGRDTDAALLASIKSALDDWASEEFQRTIALPEFKPQPRTGLQNRTAPQVLAP